MAWHEIRVGGGGYCLDGVWRGEGDEMCGFGWLGWCGGTFNDIYFTLYLELILIRVMWCACDLDM